MYLAQWFTNLMKEKGIDAWINNYSITVIFPRPSDFLIKKWALATENEISHVIVMPHVTKKLLLEFLDDYMKDKKKVIDDNQQKNKQENEKQNQENLEVVVLNNKPEPFFKKIYNNIKNITLSTIIFLYFSYKNYN